MARWRTIYRQLRVRFGSSGCDSHRLLPSWVQPQLPLQHSCS